MPQNGSVLGAGRRATVFGLTRASLDVRSPVPDPALQIQTPAVSQQRALILAAITNRKVALTRIHERWTGARWRRRIPCAAVRPASCYEMKQLWVSEGCASITARGRPAAKHKQILAAGDSSMARPSGRHSLVCCRPTFPTSPYGIGTRARNPARATLGTQHPRIGQYGACHDAASRVGFATVDKQRTCTNTRAHTHTHTHTSAHIRMRTYTGKPLPFSRMCGEHTLIRSHAHAHILTCKLWQHAYRRRWQRALQHCAGGERIELGRFRSPGRNQRTRSSLLPLGRRVRAPCPRQLE